MRIPHPVWRGFWLAVVMMAGLVLMGFSDALGAFRLDRRLVAHGGAIVVGAFLGALPERLRGGGTSHQRTTWLRCLRAFLAGGGMALALGVAGDGRILPALLTGSAGAFAFCALALVTGFITARIMGRAQA